LYQERHESICGLLPVRTLQSIAQTTVVKATEHRSVYRDQLGHNLGHPPQQRWIRLEEVLVEVLAADLSGAQRKTASQAAPRINLTRQPGQVIRGHVMLLPDITGIPRNLPVQSAGLTELAGALD
jgi:hypothetical protein